MNRLAVATRGFRGNCLNKRLAIATRGFRCTTTIVDAWREIIRLNAYVKRMVIFDFER